MEIESKRRDLAGWAGVLVRGMAMGVAEIVPGVSGGTIAFVTGIYRELVSSLAAFSPLTAHWALTDPKRFWQHHNLSFLACLGCGMLISILLFAHLLKVAIETTPNLVWGFFFGLILFSVVEVGRMRRPLTLATLGVAGFALGLASIWLEPQDGKPSQLAYFIGGALAVSAWLLPAISGSFLLLVLGLYTQVLEALATFDWAVLAVFLLGVVTGLALSARALSYLMHRFPEPLLGFLAGFMAGALAKLWPWQAEGALLLPEQWSQVTGAPAQLGATVAMMLAGVAALWLLTRLKQ